MLRNCRRLRVLTWHVHGNYLYYLTQTPFDFYLVTKPDHPTGYAGKVGLLPWDDNVHEVNADDVASREFDVILYQQRSHWERDQEFQFPDSLLRPRYHLLKCRASQNVDADANTRRALTRL